MLGSGGNLGVTHPTPTLGFHGSLIPFASYFLGFKVSSARELPPLEAGIVSCEYLAPLIVCHISPRKNIIAQIPSPLFFPSLWDSLNIHFTFTLKNGRALLQFPVAQFLTCSKQSSVQHSSSVCVCVYPIYILDNYYQSWPGSLLAPSRHQAVCCVMEGER